MSESDAEDDNGDELEQRKREMWSLDEVRGGGVSGSSGGPPRPSDSVDTSGTSEPSDTTDTEGMTDTTGMTDTDDTTDTSGTAATGDTRDTGGTAEVADPTDTKNSSKTAGTSDTADTSVTAASTELAGTNTRAAGATVREMADDARRKGLAVRDLHNVNVYLYEDIYEEMIATFKELDTEYFLEHGEELSKNKDFFNAVFRAGLDSGRLRAELELD